MPSLRFQVSLLPLVLALTLGASPVQAQPAVRPAQLMLAGQLERTGPVTVPQLQALPATTQASGARRFVGVTLWSLLDRAGILVDASRRNDLLNRYAVVTGADGRRVVFSLAELSPHFGNRQGFVAYAESVNGAPVPLRDAGLVQVLSPADVQGARHVAWPVRVEVRSSASTLPEQGDIVSHAVRVSGAVRKPGTFDLAALKALPAVTRTVGSDTFTGVSLWQLLNTTLGLATDPAVPQQTLGMYVVATGSDGQKAVISLAETDPAVGNQSVLIAYHANGVPIDVDGFARLVVPNDARRSRFVSNLVALEVFVARP